MFLHMCVILFTGGLPNPPRQTPMDADPSDADPPPLDADPPGRSPSRQTPL